MHLILTGATGLVGSSALTHILSLPASSAITRLSILSRKPVPMASNNTSPIKINVIQHSDFLSYPPSLLNELQGASGVIWALGVSQNDVPKDEYVKVTKDYALAAAKAFSTLNDKVNFVYVSGEGATTKPGMFTPLFGRVKGETEQALLEMGDATPSLRVYNLRPGYVDGIAQKEIWEEAKRRRTGLLLRVGDTVLAPVVRRFWTAGVSPTRELGKVLTELAAGDGERLEGKGVEGNGRTVTNVGFRRLAGI